jgi:hypothetical protein
MSDSQSFEVVPGALRKCKEAFDSGENWWYLLYQNMANWTMDYDDLGIIGAAAAIPTDYNAALDIIRNKLKEGYPRFQDASTALAEVAKHYENVDETYYQQFGWYHNDSYQPPPPAEPSPPPNRGAY